MHNSRSTSTVCINVFTVLTFSRVPAQIIDTQFSYLSRSGKKNLGKFSGYTISHAGNAFAIFKVRAIQTILIQDQTGGVYKIRPEYI